MKQPVTAPNESETFKLTLKTSEGRPPEVEVKCAIVEEALSELTRMRIEFLCRDRSLNLRGLLGQQVVLNYGASGKAERLFTGLCVAAECIGTYEDTAWFVLEARPRTWFLTKRQDCRIFQGMSAPKIVQEVMADEGISSDLKLRLSDSYESRDYCVQYRESDFAFISRLMEEDGIYYYFDHSAEGTQLNLADGPGQHRPLPGRAELEFVEQESVEFDHGDQVFEWAARDQVTSGRASLVSYDFEVPGNSLRVSRGAEAGRQPHGKVEVYDNEGRYTVSAHGEQHARARLEAETVQAQTWVGNTSSYNIAPGYTFKLKSSPRNGEPGEYLITRAVHYFQRSDDVRRVRTGTGRPMGTHAADRALNLGRHIIHPYRCDFEAIPKATQFRPARLTPWPNIGGVHTAVVTGPAGEEIHTDQYGRIKVQFHWDRQGKMDQNSSIWVRTMMPWTGKNWGMIAVPRIGNEVVVQFEEGDPDRPLVIGMVYNGANMPPFALPDNKTVSGVKTNSSKGGNGYNELIFEDKKGSELLRIHAERDYLQVVENNANISIGRGKKAAGDLTQIVHRNRTAFTGLIDSDLTAGMKSTAVGGAIAETVMGIKSTSAGFHIYETVGFNPKDLTDWGWAVDTVTTGVAVASGVFGVTPGGGPGDGATDGAEGIPLAPAIRAAWGLTGDYGSFAGAAAAIASGAFTTKGLKPGRTTTVNGDVNVTVNARLNAKGHHTTKIADGDVSYEVTKGKMETKVKMDVLETVQEGKHFLKVEKGAQLVSVLEGDRQIGVAKGSLITGVDKGDYKLTVGSGDITAKASAGEITLEAMKKITLKVGSSKIEISPTGIKVEAPTVTVDGKTTTEVKGGAVVEIKGAFVKIN